MKQIQKLNESMINQIAAGEVVERPSSVIKELVENSIDAKASEITIEIKDGGTSFIRVTDNGVGIRKEEVKTAFLRHATSKIENMNDLINVLTLGFRGEALSSIASVSQVEIITKTKNEKTGTRCEIVGEEVVLIKNVGSPNGTTIIVNNLFFNTPARKKFLKKTGIEAGYISDLINKFALGNPNISFKYINNSSVLLQTNGNNELEAAIFQIYGMDVAKKIINIKYEFDNIQLSGFIGRPEVARGNRNFESIFINGRLIKSKLIQSAIEDAYKTKLPIGKFPLFVLNLLIKPELVDVNVHPTKLEIRFSNEDEIYKIVKDGTTIALQSELLIPNESWGKSEKFSGITDSEPFIIDKQETLIDIEINNEENNNLVNIEILEEVFYSSPKEASSSALVSEKAILEKEIIENIENFDFKKEINENKDYEDIKKLLNIVNEKKNNITNKKNKKEIVKKEKKYKSSFFYNYRIVGQVFETYWIIKQSDSLYIIDQHAAHERVMYEDITNKLTSGKIDSQQLITPVVVNLTPLEIEVLKENKELIEKCGFEIESFGIDTYALRSVPYIFNQPENINFFLEIIDKLANISTKITNIYEAKIDNIATISCKAAVKGNNRLSSQEAEDLIKKMLEIENPFTCPHGRPTIIEMSKYELEKKFKRV